MKNLLNPKWLIVINIIPSLILLILFYGQFQIIKSQLSTEVKSLWIDFSLLLISLTCLQAVFTFLSIKKKIALSISYGLATLVIYSVSLYFYGGEAETLIPFSIARWMINVDTILYPGTFLMPTLIHSLFILIIYSSKKSKSSSAWLSFLYGISIPLLGYVFIQIILPLWQRTESNFGLHTLIILSIIASILFLFFICRGIYILVNLKSQTLLKFKVYFKFLFSIILPILGLLFNSGLLSSHYGIGNSIFGDFSNIWFFVIALINGILICLPNFKNIKFRLFRFIGLCVCFSYTLYFFLVFLPFLPLAVVAVVVIGIGFLMLSPLFLFIFQSNELYSEFIILKQTYTSLKLNIAVCLSILVIPIALSSVYLRDKYILNSALEYVYNPNYSKNYKINKKSLLATFKTIEQNKGRNRGASDGNIPFLSAYYNWLVLDNMVLSETKINTLTAIFEGTEKPEVAFVEPFSAKAKISKIKTTSIFDIKQQIWKSNIDLEITNPENTNLASFETTLNLPNGCWITNYYLNIGNRKEYGLLAEKKSAMWVFSQISNENRDPGILYYLTGNKVAFKIFPFSAQETRKSGMELIHKEPLIIVIDGHTVELGNKIDNNNIKTQSINGAVYVPKVEKAKLKLVKRTPEYHFIIDISKNKDRKKSSYYNRIEKFVVDNKINPERVKLDFTNSIVNEISYSNDWKKQLTEKTFDGGYYLEGAIKKILINDYDTKPHSFPIIISVTDSIKNSIVQSDFADYRMAFPESDNFYELDEANELWEHSLISNPKNRVNKTSVMENKGVLMLPNGINYLANDDQPSIILTSDENEKHLTDDKNVWLSGLNLQGKWLKNLTKKSSTDDSHLEIIKSSMRTGILCPLTSYIVVENEAQKMALKKKQEQILSGNKNLDPDEDTQRMDEPNFYIVLLLLLAILIYKKKIEYLNLLKIKSFYN